MAQTSTAQFPADSEGQKHATLMAVFPTFLEKTEKQLAMLTGIVNRLEDIMVRKSTLGGETVEFPEEVVKTATDVSVKALHQVDNIIDDMVRWTISPDRLENIYEKYLTRSVDLQESMLVRSKISCFPHIVYGAEVFQIGENEWAAVMNSGKDAYVMGKGATAYDALRDFDACFLNGQVIKDTPKTAPLKKIKKKVDGSKTLG